MGNTGMYIRHCKAEIQKPYDMKIGDEFYMSARKYKILDEYEHFVLCENRNGMARYKRCFSWFETRRAKAA